MWFMAQIITSNGYMPLLFETYSVGVGICRWAFLRITGDSHIVHLIKYLSLRTSIGYFSFV